MGLGVEQRVSVVLWREEGVIKRVTVFVRQVFLPTQCTFVAR